MNSLVASGRFLDIYYFFFGRPNKLAYNLTAALFLRIIKFYLVDLRLFQREILYNSLSVASATLFCFLILESEICRIFALLQAGQVYGVPLGGTLLSKSGVFPEQKPCGEESRKKWIEVSF